MYKGTWQEQFWSKVQRGLPNECWLWSGGTVNKLSNTALTYGVYGRRGQYGRADADTGEILAHRIMWVLTQGSRVPRGMIIRHACDIPLCVNPRHLLIGTESDNCHDKISRHRQAMGSGVNTCKLTPNSVQRIRRLFSDEGWSKRDLVEVFGVSRSNISAIVERRTWKHL